MTMSKVFAYVRVSTVKQGEKGVSLQEQRDAILRYCERESLEILEWFEERQTAAKSGRPVFGQMLTRLRQGKASGIVIHKIDRSARNLRDWAKLGELIDRGIRIHFANESLDLHTRGGRLSADIQAVVAADYIRNLREESRKGFYGRLKQGLYPMPAPMGYQDNGGGNVKTFDPQRAPLVKRAFELYATGRYTLDTLLLEVHKLGLRNRQGILISRNGLVRMLHNPFYTGLMRVRKTGEFFVGAHEPLISRALFERVQQAFSGRARLRIRHHEFLYRHQIKCKLCGRKLTGELQKGNVYYRCHSKDCPTMTIREELIDAGITSALRSLEFTVKEREYLDNVLREQGKIWDSQTKKLRESSELRLSQVNNRLARLTDAFLDQAIDRETFEERKGQLLAERLDIEQSLSGLNAPRSDFYARVQKFFELSNMATQHYILAKSAEKRQLLQIISSNLTVTRRNLDIALSFPFNLIAKRALVSHGAPHRDTIRTLDAIFAGVVAYCRTTPEDADMFLGSSPEEDDSGD